MKSLSILVCTLAASSTACVTQSTYDACVASRDAQTVADRGQVRAAQAELASFRQEVATRDARLAALGTDEHNLRASLDESTAMNEELRGELTRLGQNVDAMLKEKGTLSTALADAKERLAELRRAQAAAEARAQIFRDIATRFKPEIDAGKMRVAIRHGRVALLVNGDLLFAGAAATLRPTGADWIKRLAAALLAVAPPASGRRFVILAHADSPKVRPSFEVGAARAVTVIDRLVTLGLKPEQLVVASAGSFDPLAAADASLGVNALEVSIQPSEEDAVTVSAGK